MAPPTLDIQSNQGLRIGRTKIEAPVAKLQREAIGMVHRSSDPDISVLNRLYCGTTVGNSAIDLSAAGKHSDPLIDEFGQTLS